MNEYTLITFHVYCPKYCAALMYVVCAHQLCSYQVLVCVCQMALPSLQLPAKLSPQGSWVS